MKFSQRFAAICAFILLCVTALQPISVYAAAAAYSPVTGTTFNDARGKEKQQYAVLEKVALAIDAAPERSIIRIATWSLDSMHPFPARDGSKKAEGIIDKLINAHKRNVNVRILVNNHAWKWQTVERLKIELGINTKNSSFITTCVDGCMTDPNFVKHDTIRAKTAKNAQMHAKFFLFSTAGNSKLVSMVSSGNLTDGSANSQWNDLHTMVGGPNGNIVDDTAYNGYKDYFDEMVRDRNNANYYRVVSSKDGVYTTMFFPKSDADTNDKTIDILDKVTCTGAASGYGQNGRTIIKIAISLWRESRVDVAKKLYELHSKGCVVQVVLRYNKYDARANQAAEWPVLSALLSKKHAKYGRMSVYSNVQDKNRDGLVDYKNFIHYKQILINGVYSGNKKTKSVYTGSANLTGVGVKYGNDVTMRINSPSVFSAYNTNFDYFRSTYTEKLTSLPPKPPTQPPSEDDGVRLEEFED